MQRTHKNIYIWVQQTEEKCLPWQHLLLGIAEKLISSNLCRVMECKEAIKLFISSRNRRKVLPWQHLLPGIVEKLVSSNPCRGFECKEPTKRFLNPRNMRKCCQVPTKSQFEKQYRKSIAMATNLPKSIITTLVVPLARNIS